MSRSNVFLNEALELASRGWRVFPLKPKSKVPIMEEWQNKATTNVEQIIQWWTKWPHANVGIATGADSNLVVLDVDVKDGKCGDESLAELERQWGELPTTIEVLTRIPGGRHIYFSYPNNAEVPSSVEKLAPGLDIRGKGGYVVAPPSFHPDTGGTYEWCVDHHPEEVVLTPLPPWLLNKLLELSQKQYPSKAHDSTHKIPDGQRNDTLFRKACSLQAQGMSNENILEEIRNTPCAVPLPDNEIQDLVRSATTRYSKGTPSGTDKGLIKDMAEHLLADHFFAKDPGGLLYHFEGGCYWPTGEEFVSAQFQRILEDEKRTKHWSTHRARELTAYLTVQAPKLWEAPPSEIINLSNGLYNLQTGTLLGHDPHHLCSVQLPVAFDAQATCPHWQQFLHEVLGKDVHALFFEMVAYLMRADMGQQKAFLLFGEGSNGKSTLLTGLVNFLGLHNRSAISLHKLETDRFAVVRLIGKLVNVYADLPAQHLASSAIFKSLTGGDPLLAERKFHESFEFRPFCRLLFSANHYPTCQDASPAFFRRWVVLPFERSFSDHDPTRVDPKVLEARLCTPAELSGLLNEALRALSAFQKRGRFVECEATQGAWAEFRDQTDPLANWLDQQTVTTPTAFISRKDLRIKYANYLKGEGRPPIGEKALYAGVRRLRPMVEEGQKMVGRTSERGFHGLGLKANNFPQHQKQQKQETPTSINGGQDEGGKIKEEGEDKQIKLGPAAFAALPASQPGGDCVQTLFPDPNEVNPWK